MWYAYRDSADGIAVVGKGNSIVTWHFRLLQFVSTLSTAMQLLDNDSVSLASESSQNPA